MKLECIATVLNLRSEPKGTVVGELRLGDIFEVNTSQATVEWVFGKATSGISAGKSGYVRRKWLIQNYSEVPALSPLQRSDAARIVADRTAEFDAIRYDLGSKAKTWKELKKLDYVDCSGWVYLICKEIIEAYGLKTKASVLYTFSDEQITNCGNATKSIVSGKYLTESLFQPGTLVGIDFAEYSWDRGRPLDIDHIMIIGEDATGQFVSQSSSSGGGVNRVPLNKWLASQASLISAGRIHLVDVLSLP